MMRTEAKQEWLCRPVGVVSGLLLAVPQLYPAAAPLQVAALIPVLYLAASRNVHSRTLLLAGVYMGFAYTLPQMIALRMPVTIALVIVVHLTVLLTIFACVSGQLLGGSALAGVFAVGALLVVLDWLNFTVVPIWGTAQSFVRPWSHYPGLILFVSFTGITGIIFALGTLQALLVNIIIRPKIKGRLFAAAAVVVLVVLAANVVVRYRQPVGKLKVAAVGWTSADCDRCGGVYSPEGFNALFAQPAAQAVRQGAKLIVSPEMGFQIGDWQREEWLEKFRKIARRYSVFLAVGYFNVDEEQNRVLFMTPEGKVAVEYTKTYLTPFENYRKGDGQLKVIDVGAVRLGGMICQDDNFTRLSRGYGREHVAVVAVPTLDWLTVRDTHLQSSIHRAIESRYAIVRAAANGISAIVSPMGKVLARRDHFLEGPGTIVAEVPVYPPSITFFSIVGHWPVVPSIVFLVIYIGRNFIGSAFGNRFPP